MKKKNIKFEVWAFNYDKNGLILDGEEFLGSFNSKTVAVDHAHKFNDVFDVYDIDTVKNTFAEGDYMEVYVEELNCDYDVEDSLIETTYIKSLYVPEGVL